jgi:uncharacterized membrane protein YcaP (DUF421 family)
MWSSIEEFTRYLLGSDTPEHSLSMLQVAIRATIVYIVGILIVRIGKSRVIGRATPLDVILGFILGSVLGRGITGSATVSSTAVATAVLVFLHWLLTWGTVYSHRLGLILKGRSKLIVEDGHARREAMHSSHLSEQDLLEALRIHAGIEDLSQVQAAYKERNGDISFIKRPGEPHVLEVEVRAGVQTIRIELR